ncbi:MAG: hypothetical protein HC875_03515 [Anaerolineales bacterium]|nr:hypothetical protein [Anaerolineales bacterium]
MKHLTPAELKEIALDIEVELGQLARLQSEIERVSQLIKTSPDLADLLFENQALKLHNFYTGCERIFQIVASELNGALPTGYDWHKRLLERMALPHEGRPALISTSTAQLLEKYLAFRHVVRNIYGYELEAGRIAQLVAEQNGAWQRFEIEVSSFVTWLRQTAEQLR